MRVRNFRKAKTGTLVIHNTKKKIGILADITFVNDYDDDENIIGVICYPYVHWEGEIMPEMCHPIHVEPMRKRDMQIISFVNISDNS